MLRQLNSRSVVVGSLIAIATVWTTMVGLGLRTTFRNQMEIAALKAERDQLNNKIEVLQKTYEVRLDQLERFVFGTLPSRLSSTPAPPQPTKRPDSWQLNRLRDIDKRLDSFEKWRMEHGKE